MQLRILATTVAAAAVTLLVLSSPAVHAQSKMMHKPKMQQGMMSDKMMMKKAMMGMSASQKKMMMDHMASMSPTEKKAMMMKMSHMSMAKKKAMMHKMMMDQKIATRTKLLNPSPTAETISPDVPSVR